MDDRELSRHFNDLRTAIDTGYARISERVAMVETSTNNMKEFFGQRLAGLPCKDHSDGIKENTKGIADNAHSITKSKYSTVTIVLSLIISIGTAIGGSITVFSKLNELTKRAEFAAMPAQKEDAKKAIISDTPENLKDKR